MKGYLILFLAYSSVCQALNINTPWPKNKNPHPTQKYNNTPPHYQRQPTTRTRREQTPQVTNVGLTPTLTLSENWRGHNRSLNLVRWDRKNHVIIYFDSKLDSISNWKPKRTVPLSYTYNGYATWICNFTSSVWGYMTRTYGDIGHDPYLYVVIHPEKYKGSLREYNLDPSNNNTKTGRANLLDLSATYLNGWLTNGTTNLEMDYILNKLAYFVEHSSKHRFGSPSFPVWKGSSYLDTAWVDIFTFDVYLNLNMSTSAQRYWNKCINKAEKSPSNITFWFRDWFLPIYTNYGGNSVLNEYFILLSAHLPNKGVRYSENLNIGSFVHFWSGAAKNNLKDLANQTFSWNRTYQEEFMTARIRFPGLNELYDWKADEKNESNSTAIHLKATDAENQVDDAPPTVYTNDDIPTTDSPPQDSPTNSALQLQPHMLYIIIGVSAAIILTLVAVLIAFLIYHKKKILGLKTEIRALTNEEVDEFFAGDPNLNPDEAQALVLSMPFIKDYEIPREQMILDYTKILGRGQFGSVIEGFIQPTRQDPLRPVAVKTVKPNVDVVCFKACLSEVKIMAYLGKHENIVELLGTCTANIQNREIFIALELCPLGNLLNFLKKNVNNFEIPRTGVDTNSFINIVLEFSPKVNLREHQREPTIRDSVKLTALDLLKWSQEISNAMVYLAEKQVIHGDLAARNILLTEDRVAKISDFGLSRQFLNYANYMKTSKLPVPWRWLSIEALKEMRFSTASDVWAFGVTMWEIFSLGDPPYGAWTYDLFFVDKLIEGNRLQMPAHANLYIYELMKDCWKTEPSKRPTFQQIHSRLEELVSKSSHLKRGRKRFPI